MAGSAGFNKARQVPAFQQKDIDALLKGKLERLSGQIELAVLAGVFVVPLVGETVPTRTHNEIQTACRAHDCRVVRNPAQNDGMTAERTPPGVEGEERVSWRYTWDVSGRLETLSGASFSGSGGPAEGRVAWECTFSYKADGRLKSAAINRYSLINGQREAPIERVIDLRMDEEDRRRPRALTLRAFFGRVIRERELKQGMLTESLENLTRLSAPNPDLPERPADRLKDIEVVIPFLERKLTEVALSEKSGERLLRNELEKQLAEAKAEREERLRQMAWRPLEEALLKNGIDPGSSPALVDLFCDSSLGHQRKRELLTEYMSRAEAACDAVRANPHFAELAEDSQKQLLAVRVALALMDQEASRPG